MHTQTINMYDENKTRSNLVFKIAIIIGSWLFISLFISIVVFLFIEGIPGFKAIFSSKSWDFSKNYGVLPLLFGTLSVTLLAIIIAAPLATFTSLFINEFLPKKISHIFNSIIEILAGIPSVVYGFFGVMFFVGNGILSYSVLLAGIILAFMILPNILHFCNVGIKSVSDFSRNGSLALGANRLETSFKIVLPGAKIGIIAGILMGIARAIGETIAVTMIIGNVANLPTAHDFFTKFFSMFLLAPNNTIAAAIATNFLESGAHEVTILYAIACVLFIFVIFFNLLSLFFLNNYSKKITKFFQKKTNSLTKKNSFSKDPAIQISNFYNEKKFKGES